MDLNQLDKREIEGKERKRKMLKNLALSESKIGKMSTLVIIIGLSDFGPGRAAILSKIINSLGYHSVIITNKPIYLNESKSLNGSNIIFLNVSIPGYNSPLGRLLFYLIFFLLCFLEVLKLARDKRYKKIFIIARHPYPLSIILSFMVKLLLGNGENKRIVVIADITDLWPESFTFMLKNPLADFLVYSIKALNHIIYPRIDGLITHNKYYEVYIKNTYLGKKKNIPAIIIPHLVDLSFFRPTQKIKALLRIEKYFTKREISIILNNFIIGYAGLISESIGSDLLIPMIKEILNRNKHIAFLIVGEGPFKQVILNMIGNKMRCNNLIIKGPLPPHLIRYILNLFDIGIITSYYREYSPATLYWYPKKLGEYAACGRPIIYIGYSKFISSLIRRYNCGFAIEPNLLDYLAYCIDKIKEDYKSFSNGALQMAKMEFSPNTAKAKIKKFLMSFYENI